LPLAAQVPADTSGPADLAAALATIDGWQKEHPDLVRRVETGKSVGERPLFVLRIGSAPDGAPELFVVGGIHGHEHSETDALWLVGELLRRAADPAVATLLSTRVLWVQPLVNPDGVHARQRKNKNGVDLNRNFDARWKKGADPDARTYSGPSAFSEPESRALREFLLSRPYLRACLDLHRSTNLLVPAQRGAEGAIDPPVREAFAALTAAVGWAGPVANEPAHWPTMGGLFVDWAWAELGTVAFAMENRGDPAGPAEQNPRWRCLLHLLEKCAEYPESRAEAAVRFAPRLVTERTRADAKELARLQQPGTILFRDGFEDEASLHAYFERNGQDQGHLRLVQGEGIAHTGKGALQLTAPDHGGASSGASAVLWLGDQGHDCAHLRYWIRYADDYDQGNLNHTGGSLEGVAGTDKWTGMGTAGQRPLGDDQFSTRVEPWRDWQRIPAPGALHCYTYWMDMLRDRDGNWWGNMLAPPADQRVVPARGTWQCVELRVQANHPGAGDGELAVWLDGRLYLHFQGIRWRTSDAVRIKRATLMVYVHQARRDNRVWYDDVVVSTGYIGTGEPPAK
jgi:predicted deacylase